MEKTNLATKVCFCGAGASHLKTTCPVANEMRRMEGYLDNLKGPGCYMDCQRNAMETTKKKVRLASVMAQCATAKERPVSPEQLIAKLGMASPRRARPLSKHRPSSLGTKPRSRRRSLGTKSIREHEGAEGKPQTEDHRAQGR